MQMHDERNYHIFYCMLAGLSPQEKQQLEVKDATDYFYLIQVTKSHFKVNCSKAL